MQTGGRAGRTKRFQVNAKHRVVKFVDSAI